MENTTESTLNDIVLTGVRPTGSLTIANYLGAMKPIIDLQKEGFNPYVFVADLHAFTDNEPSKVKQYVMELIADYISLGLDPARATLYTQTHIKGQITTLMSYLARLITVAELLRIPTLKDKIKDGQGAETANALLLLYPVLMAADILVQKATRIPVGEDQVAHIETTRDLAHRFNKRYGDIFPIPQVQQYQSLRILSLKGDGKMSKSSPEGAIFLTDTMEDVEKKIKRAQTAFAGEMSPSLESLILIAKGLATNDDDVLKVDDFINKHLAKENVMGGFKELVVSIVQKFLSEFQKKRSEVLQNPQYLADILAAGGKVALANANKTLFDVEAAMMRGESSELTN